MPELLTSSAASPEDGRWYLDLLEYEQSCKQAQVGGCHVD